MCGIAGIVAAEGRTIETSTLRRMASALEHRGPDGYGLFLGVQVGFAHTRLAIVDLMGGAQPMTNEDGSVVVVYNGEIYNFLELRTELQGFGHAFRTRCDTEVLLHGWEQWGEGLLERLNGQFAFALYDRRSGSVVLARDRFGIRPLYYSVLGGNLYFASEVKALFATGEVEAAPDFEGLDEVYTFWGALAPRTAFRGISQLEPGTRVRWKDGRLDFRRYYALGFGPEQLELPSCLEELDGLMRTSVGFRLRADVPVGGYLSGGLDSSITCALAANESPFTLRTFSVAFLDPMFDESSFQAQLAGALGSSHSVVEIANREIPSVFPDVIRHTETPLVRTAPAPLFLLSKLTREQGIKVVLTGEGADELFYGYDLFKETAVRRFCLRQPDSTWRPRLFDRLYPYLGGEGRSGHFWRQSFLRAGPPDDPLFSHIPRFALTSRIKDFYSDDVRHALREFDALEQLRSHLPSGFTDWTSLQRAAYLEMHTLLPSYLLSSQGDRMAMAHSIEGRFPFLDHRLFEFVATLPDRLKLRVLSEKDILRRWAATVLPHELAARPKQPYRAPDVPAFFDADVPDYVDELMSSEAIERMGYFDAARVEGLLRRCRSGHATGFRENQAFVAVLSTQLWHAEFIESPATLQEYEVDPDLVLAEQDIDGNSPVSIIHDTSIKGVSA